ncbi:MAG: ABC transporter ATP-binding protein [Planctomycetota bacterium]
MSDKHPAIRIQGLGKAYNIKHGAVRHITLAESMLHRMRNPFERAEIEQFWALQDIDLEVAQGDVLGIVGHNGAGKSTLLKVLSQITAPTKGSIELYGRVGSLLEVGTGFHPELSGRENIFLNGAILGMRRPEIRKQFDAIVDFAGVEKFLDTPVKRYSSGMYVRLAFGVAAHLEPEILIVDEVLSVGDAEFQNKCLGKMRDVSKSGRTVLFVSHNLAAVRNLCNSAILLRGGRLIQHGTTDEVLTEYLSCLSDRLSLKVGDRTDRDGLGDVRIQELNLFDEAGTPIGMIQPNTPFEVEVVVDAKQLTRSATVSIDIDTMDGQRITALFSKFHSQSFELQPGRNVLRCRCEGLNLRPGTFLMSVMVGNAWQFLDLVRDAARLEVASADVYGSGQIHKPESGVMVSRFRWDLVDQPRDAAPSHLATTNGHANGHALAGTP